LRGDVPFQGREAFAEQQRSGVTKRFTCFTVDDPDIVLLGRETIYRNDEPVGWLTSGGYGYTVGKNIGYGYVRNTEGLDRSYLISGRYELEVATARVRCKLETSVPYDPQGRRIKV